MDHIMMNQPDVALGIFDAIVQALLALIGAQMVFMHECHCCFFHLLHPLHLVVFCVTSYAVDQS
jgi:hypothetical protein